MSQLQFFQRFLRMRYRFPILSHAVYLHFVLESARAALLLPNPGITVRDTFLLHIRLHRFPNRCQHGLFAFVFRKFPEPGSFVVNGAHKHIVLRLETVNDSFLQGTVAFTNNFYRCPVIHFSGESFRVYAFRIQIERASVPGTAPHIRSQGNSRKIQGTCCKKCCRAARIK